MEQDVPEVLVASSQFPKRVWEERCFAVSRRSAALAGSSAPRCCLGSCTVVAGTSPAEGRNDITPWNPENLEKEMTARKVCTGWRRACLVLGFGIFLKHYPPFSFQLNELCPSCAHTLSSPARLKRGPEDILDALRLVVLVFCNDAGRSWILVQNNGHEDCYRSWICWLWPCCFQVKRTRPDPGADALVGVICSCSALRMFSDSLEEPDCSGVLTWFLIQGSFCPCCTAFLPSSCERVLSKNRSGLAVKARGGLNSAWFAQRKETRRFTCLLQLSMGACVCTADRLKYLKTTLATGVSNFPEGVKVYNLFFLRTPHTPPKALSLPLQPVPAPAGTASRFRRAVFHVHWKVPVQIYSYGLNCSPSDLHILFYFQMLGCILWSS